MGLRGTGLLDFVSLSLCASCYSVVHLVYKALGRRHVVQASVYLYRINVSSTT